MIAAQVDTRGLPCTAGEYGKIRIAGVQVGRGYLGGKPELCRQRQLPDCVGFVETNQGERVFITSDRGVVQDGKIYFAGREDTTLIENVLLSSKNVLGAAVGMETLAEDGNQIVQRLFALVITQSDVDEQKVRANLIQECVINLPTYSIPWKVQF
eukprot:758941-Hanusia_phi.AAC.7